MTSASHEVVTTRGGAVAMLDCAFGEVMHPIVGPIVESHSLYVSPSRLAARLDEPGEQPLVLFDVGLGAGSNACAAWSVSEARAQPSLRLHIVSFDRTTAALELALADSHAAAFGFEGALGEAGRTLFERGCVESEATTWSLVLGELPASLSATPSGLADVVYWDPFSPRSNGALWSFEAFSAVRRLCDPAATLHTYSAATATRAALLLAGFAVGLGDASGSKGETTIASVDPRALERPLGARWLSRLGRSSAPLPSDAPPDAMQRIARAPQFRI